MNRKKDTEAQEILLLQKKASAFHQTDTLVHIPYKRGYWKRGKILKVNADFFILEERLEGQMPVFFIEIKDIQIFTPRAEVRSK